MIKKKKTPIIKAPRNTLALLPKKTIDDHWVRIVNYVFANPDANDRKLYNRYGEICNIKLFKTFVIALKNREIGKVRKAARKRKSKLDKPLTQQDSVAATADMVSAFEVKKKSKAVIHLNAADALIDNAHIALKVESQEVLEKKANLSQHLTNINLLHKTAKDVYGIGEGSPEDKAKQQIAIIIGHDPMRARREAKGQVIDIASS